MNWNIFSIIFVLFTIYGFFSIVRSVRELRAPRNYENALLTWAEPPRSSFKYEFYAWMAISIHRIAVIGLGLVAFVILVLHPPWAINFQGGQDVMAYLIVILAGGGGSALAGFLWGRSLFWPIAEAMGGDHHYAVTAEGMLYMGLRFPWNTFSHLSLNAEHNMIQIWSASLPGTVGFTLSPPSPESVSRLMGILQSYLPASETSSPGSINGFIFPVLMACFSAPFVVLALLTFLLPGGIAITANCLLIYFLGTLGGKLIMRLVYGGKAQPIHTP